MELGGKDAAIVLDDVLGINKVASILMRGVFQSAGQNCIGIERIVACQGVYDKLVSILESRIRNLRVGSAMDSSEGVDVGAMISDANFDRLESMIEAAVKNGARLLAGGKRYDHPDFPKGHYFTPTLLADVTEDMAIAQEECFAPIAVVMRAQNWEHAVRIANGTMYGLGASVFGIKDTKKVVSSLQTGMVSVNDFAVYYAVQLPFGGVKGSGMFSSWTKCRLRLVVC
jgi:acyl-CoA reductase-like NAD-dependent aldehyde dehydrogenase